MTLLKRVFVVGGDRQIETMFAGHPEFLITYVIESADVVCFIGGADVSPSLYKQKQLSLSYTDKRSDERDLKAWDKVKDTNKFKVGICRGGQFLNVMNGGTMWQDVDRHNRGPHNIQDLFLKKEEADLFQAEFTVTSTHHQMMRAAPTGHVLAIAHLSTHKIDDTWNGSVRDEKYPGEDFDTEVIWYPASRSLCFQPHPEYLSAGEDTRKYFFNLIENLY